MTGAGVESRWPGWVIALSWASCWLLSRSVWCWLGWDHVGTLFLSIAWCETGAQSSAPWKEFRREGNSLFLSGWWQVDFVVVLVLAGMPLWLPWVRSGAAPEPTGLIIGLILVVTLFVGMVLPYAIVSSFMGPIMYRRRCGALQGARESIGSDHVGARTGYFVSPFQFVIGLAMAMGACAIMCVTCCIAAIPYVGTVILLPVFVFSSAFNSFSCGSLGRNTTCGRDWRQPGR